MVTHTSCPKCGSTDNLAVWEWEEDGVTPKNYHCYTPGCDYHSGTVPGKTDENFTAYELPVLKPVGLQSRRLDKETLARHGVGLHGEWLYFPCYRQGILVAAKTRKAREIAPGSKKVMPWQGDGSAATLFGTPVCADRGKLIITEGELDCMSVRLMMGVSFNVVSVTHGAAGAVKDIAREMEWIERYETVYLSFDADNAGFTATQAVLALFPKGFDVRIVTLPLGFKDPNEMWLAEKDNEYRAAVYAAQCRIQPALVDPDVLTEEAIQLLTNPAELYGTPSGWCGLDKILGGFRMGDVITLVGGTGIGKTTVTEHVAYLAYKAGLDVCFIPLEMSRKVTIIQFVEIDLGISILGNPEWRDYVTIEQVRESLDRLTPHIRIYNHFGSLDREAFKASIARVARVNGCKLFVLDHITAAVNSQSGDNERQRVDTLMGDLRALATQLDITFWVVTHQSRDKDDKEDERTSLHKIRLSQGIAQSSHCVLGIERKRNSPNTMLVKTLKAHTLMNVPWSFGLEYDRAKRLLYEQSRTGNTHQRLQEQVRERHSSQADSGGHEYSYGEDWEGYEAETEEEEYNPEEDSRLRDIVPEVHAQPHLQTRLDTQPDCSSREQGDTDTSRPSETVGGTEGTPTHNHLSVIRQSFWET